MDFDAIEINLVSLIKALVKIYIKEIKYILELLDI